MAKLKKTWEERVRSGKTKRSPICKIHKTPHVYDIIDDEYVNRFGGVSGFTRCLRCKCGKKKMETVDWEMGQKITDLTNFAFSNRHITDLKKLVDMMLHNK